MDISGESPPKKAFFKTYQIVKDEPDKFIEVVSQYKGVTPVFCGHVKQESCSPWCLTLLFSDIFILLKADALSSLTAFVDVLEDECQCRKTLQ